MSGYLTKNNLFDNRESHTTNDLERLVSVMYVMTQTFFNTYKLFIIVSTLVTVMLFADLLFLNVSWWIIMYFVFFLY